MLIAVTDNDEVNLLACLIAQAEAPGAIKVARVRTHEVDEWRGVAATPGLKIDLLIRGVCALRPGIAGLSDNIRVRSIVGGILEHSRIFYFRNGGDEQVYLSSADWMDRNFFRRIETGFPVLNPKLKKRVIAEGLKPYLRDNVQAWDMQPDGSYRRRTKRGAKAYCAQCELLTLLARKKKS